MKKPQREPIRVTDHAVLRYLERQLDFDIEQVRAHIISICEPAVATGARRIKAEGATFEIVGCAIVTVKTEKAWNH